MQDYPSDPDIEPQVYPFVDLTTNTISYVVKDPAGMSCAVIDPVLDFDFSSGRATYHSADKLIECIQQNGLKLEWLIETHVHADHLSAAPYIKSKAGGKIGISRKISTVQSTFSKIFSEPAEFRCDGSQFDHLFVDGEVYQVGSIDAVAIETPGHTPACMTHLLGNSAFVGDTLFMPDGGTARADFPGGDAGQLYDSIQTLLRLPARTQLFMCHDYGPGGRDIQWKTSVAEQLRDNIHVGAGATRGQFIKMRETRDASLEVPNLIIPSLQVNMRAGNIPLDNYGRPFIKIPVNAL
ncbi:MAG: MBL fold metallo-hydrolase [bacterium]